VIRTDGWSEDAIQIPGPESKTGPGLNALRGVVLHSAEGTADGLLSVLRGYQRLSWHFSVLLDGTLWQHYPVTAVTWHATAFNPFTIGIEHEGQAAIHGPLNRTQVRTTRALLASIEDFTHTPLIRPRDSQDRFATAWEHREVIRFDGWPTACPSDRIPWPLLLEDSMNEPWPTQKVAIAALFRIVAAIFEETPNLADLSEQDKQVLRWLVEVSEAR